MEPRVRKPRQLRCGQTLCLSSTSPARSGAVLARPGETGLSAENCNVSRLKCNDRFVHKLRLDFQMTQRTPATVRFSDGLTGAGLIPMLKALPYGLRFQSE